MTAAMAVRPPILVLLLFCFFSVYSAIFSLFFVGSEEVINGGLSGC
ncbi:hypothetical protein A2U01_0053827 [Trifolium medium]|uniref:Uncharacterized protein n=1 Tax=Trifolium medium TaxID=97028 RepID=A0A392R7N4_9FABA|nr:hypothetical protein [Trifolium medium]